MNDRSKQIERRRYVRISPKGSVRFRAPEHHEHGRISDLSAGGAYIQTGAHPKEQLPGREIEFELRLDAGNAEWLRGTGKIVRLDREGFAIAFDDQLAAPLRHMIVALSTASHARAGVTAVVLIDADPQRSAAMAAGFRATGCSVIEARTPLEAIVRLGESSFEPDVIAIADSRTDAADHMRTFVEREHPNARLITIGDEIFQPDGFADWLSSANPGLDLPARVHEVLGGPRRY